MTVQRPLPEARPGRLHGLPPALSARRAPAANATLVAREELTGTLGVFTIVLDQPLVAFNPGQYVSVGVEHDGQLIQRPYSIVSLDAGRARVELFIRRLPDGRLSNLLWPLALGARVRVGQARGLFTLDAADRRPRLMVGTGTGLAPLLAMLADAAAREDHAPNVLIHGVSFHAELAFAERLGGWIAAGVPIDYRPTVSRPHERRNESWTGPTGRAEAQLARLLEEEPLMRDATAYLCGNPEMIDACRATLLAAGFAPGDVRVEQFHGPVSARVS